MILVTGGSGFLGRAVASRLPGAVTFSSRELDLTDGQAVADAFSDWKPEVVVHLAARVGGVKANMSRQADFLIDNLRIDGNVLAALRVTPPTHLLSMLSTSMYPGQLASERYPMTEGMVEDGPPPPSNASYATAKRALWHGTRALNRQYGVPYTALVPANLYGPGDHFGQEDCHFLAAAIDRIERARVSGAPSVKFFGTGRALRQYVLVDDLAALVALLVERGPLNSTVNVAPERSRTVRELAFAVAEVAGYEGEIAFTGRGPDGQLLKDVSTEHLQAAIPEWRDIETDLADGLALTLERYRTMQGSAGS
jgi:GDP-L-fucose synthase